MNSLSEPRMKLRSLFPDAGSVDGKRFAGVEIEPTRQKHELAKHGAEHARLLDETSL